MQTYSVESTTLKPPNSLMPEGRNSWIRPLIYQ